MIKTVKIGNKNVKLNPNAATPVYFNQVFGADFFQLTEDAIDGKADISTIEAWSRCGYIMAMQAKKDAEEMSFDGYLEWLSGFGPTDIVEAAGDIIDAWHGTTDTTAKPKN